ncbi:MAG: hypothetical protein R3247_03850 [Rhodothermales bacterium]|nr:hypothetical protein [Rhodothermales bacterium]
MPDAAALLPDAARALAEAFGGPAPAAQATLADVRRYVEAHVARLLDANPALLMHVLYRVDVAERDVRRVFDEAPPGEIARRLADLLVARQLVKLETRRRYPPPGAP